MQAAAGGHPVDHGHFMRVEGDVVAAADVAGQLDQVQPVLMRRPADHLRQQLRGCRAGCHDGVALDAAHHVEIDHGDRLL